MIFLDNAASSHPKPPPVHAAVEAALRQAVASDHGSGAAAAAGTRCLATARQEAGALLGVADPRRVVFTLNATDALNMAIHGILEPGDHVVTSVGEHNAVCRPLTHLQMKGVIALTRVEIDADGGIALEALDAAIQHRTRLVVLGHGNSVLGTLQPMEDIARRVKARGARLLVDASHTAGRVPVDVDGWGLDAVAVSGHGALMGPAGTGLLLVGDGLRIRPTRLGESGHRPAQTTHPLALPEALEAGMPNIPGIAGLGAGIRFIREVGVSRVREHETMMIKRFIGALGLDERFTLYAARGDLPRTGTVSFNLGGFPPARLVEILERRAGVFMAAGLHGSPGVHRRLGTLDAGTVRASVGWFTREEEIDRSVAVLRSIAEDGLRRALGSVNAGEVAGAT
ncbi:MAG: aminotransferase class V-fold PLP-dependent enzyme [Acidobacteriota bacterium]